MWCAETLRQSDRGHKSTGYCMARNHKLFTPAIDALLFDIVVGPSLSVVAKLSKTMGLANFKEWYELGVISRNVLADPECKKFIAHASADGLLHIAGVGAIFPCLHQLK